MSRSSVSGDGVISHRAGLRVALLREICDNPVLRERWNALVDRVDQPQVFYTYEWALAVWRTYSATLRPLLFLAYDEQESLCAVAALATNPSGTEVSFLCATTGDYCDFLCLPEQKRPFLDVILAELRQQGIGSVTLANLPADSSTMAVLEQAAKKQRYFYFARTGYLCAQVSLNQVERRTDGRLVVPGGKRLRRLTNAMARTAPVHFEHARSWNEAQAILSQFARAHVVRFLVTGRISNLARLERRLFLEELAKLLSESGWLAISRATAGTRAIAWNYGFQFHGTWFWYQPTFDSDLEKYSPGFCLLARLIEEAAGDKSFELIDLGLGAEEYKERFGNRTRETLHVTLQTSVVSHIRTIVRFRAATMVKAVPGLELRVRAVAEKLLRVRGRARERGLAGTLFWLARRVGDLFWSRTEVFFFEWCGPAASDHEGWELRPLNLEQLAAAAEQYPDDESTIAYLIRAAQRLRAGNDEGFVLTDGAGIPVHFGWIRPFGDFFLAELNARVSAPSPESVLLFDCWTPAAARGHGYYGRAIGLIADRIHRGGKRPWVFSAASNMASIRGIEKAGFQRRYSLVRQKVFNLQRVKGQTPCAAESAPAEVSAPL